MYNDSNKQVVELKTIKMKTLNYGRQYLDQSVYQSTGYQRKYIAVRTKYLKLHNCNKTNI